jgi:hypothetical protein
MYRKLESICFAIMLTFTVSTADAQAEQCTGTSGASGPLQNYCEYKCRCNPMGSPNSDPFYVQVMVPRGTTDCSGTYMSQAMAQAYDICNPALPSAIEKWIPDGQGGYDYTIIL